MTHHQVLALLISRSSSAEKSLICWPALDKHRSNSRLPARSNEEKLDHVTIHVDKKLANDRSLRETGCLNWASSHRRELELELTRNPFTRIERYKVDGLHNMDSQNSPKMEQESESPIADSASKKPNLTNLPSEIIHQILLWLPGISLYAVSLTCKSLNAHTMTDSLWENLLDSPDLQSPHPYLNYRSLHHALSPHLFLRRKVFIGDRRPFGSVLLSKYMPTSGTLEAFSLIATHPVESDTHAPTTWSYDPEIIIEPFSPKINLRKDPDLKISPNSRASEDGEIPVQRRGIFATYFRAEAILEKDIYPQMSAWPSRNIPAATRVRNQSSNGFRSRSQARQRGPFMRLPSSVSINGTSVSIGGIINVNDSTGAAVDRSAFLGPSSKNREDIDPNAKWKVNENKRKSGFLSETAFRLRKWAILGDQEGDVDSRVRMGEMVETFAELDEELWTPTKEYPLRGIWLGNYRTHGAEFLLFHQPVVSSGAPRLEVIKLTGDPNVPRGEYSVIVDDMSTPIRVADEEEHEWPGAKVYHARGQVASTDFRNSMFLQCEMIIPDPERDWKEGEELKRKKAGGTNVDETSGSNDTPQASDDIGEGWGVGVRNRRESIGSSIKRRAKRKASYMNEPWVHQRVAVNWKYTNGDKITSYKRVDIEKFLDS